MNQIYKNNLFFLVVFYNDFKSDLTLIGSVFDRHKLKSVKSDITL